MAVANRLPEIVDTYEIVEFLRRFASMMSSGDAADRFAEAALLIEDLAHDIGIANTTLDAEILEHSADIERRKVAEAEVETLKTRWAEIAAKVVQEERRSKAAHDALTLEKNEEVGRADRAEAELANVSEELRQLRTSLSGPEQSVALVPIAKLQTMRSQFQSLGLEFRKRGDVASEFMCEIGTCTLDQFIPVAPPKLPDAPE